MRIIGIDPGSRTTGYGVIETEGKIFRYLDSGCIQVGKRPFTERLGIIFKDIVSLVDTYQPHMAAIEHVFVHRGLDAALKLGQARGAAIAALSQADLPVHEYAPRQIKSAVSGYGAATKDQVQEMVKIMLSLSDTPQSDAADALAIAICHHHTHRHQMLSKA